MSFNVGEIVGPYRVIEQLGQGGMATVYKAYHAALDRYVALKVLHPAFLEDPNFQARFQREARLVAKLEHPNIVPIYDYAEQEGHPYLVMKFIEGETLKARLARGPIDPAEIENIVDKVGAALAYAHKHSILHRDIKPSNVLMANDGQIYLADFGLARIAHSGASTLTSDMIIGTPKYISPEQALGTKNLDEGTDIYSFGVMMYELVVGKVPFSADTPFSVIHDHIYSPLPLPRNVNPRVPESVEQVLLKALSKERRYRYKDVPTLVEAFKQAWHEAILMQQAVIVPPQSEAPTVISSPSQTVPSPLAIPGTDNHVHMKELPALAPSGRISDTDDKSPGKIPWMWLAVGVVLLLGCLVTFLALVSVRRQFKIAHSPSPTAISSPIPSSPPGNTIDLFKAVQAATQNSTDPDTFVQLALADWKAKLPAAAEEAVTNIEKTTGGNERFLWDSGAQLAAENAWLPAARLYVDAAEYHLKNSATLPDNLQNQVHEVIFLAFLGSNAPDYITYQRLSKIDDALALIAKAQHQFTHADQAGGQVTLDQLKQINPDLPEIQLLQAEFDAMNSLSVAARADLASLRSSPAVTAWMLAEANHIEGTLP